MNPHNPSWKNLHTRRSNRRMMVAFIEELHNMTVCATYAHLAQLLDTAIRRQILSQVSPRDIHYVDSMHLKGACVRIFPHDHFKLIVVKSLRSVTRIGMTPRASHHCYTQWWNPGGMTPSDATRVGMIQQQLQNIREKTVGWFNSSSRISGMIQQQLQTVGQVRWKTPEYPTFLNSTTLWSWRALAGLRKTKFPGVSPKRISSTPSCGLNKSNESTYFPLSLPTLQLAVLLIQS